MNSDTNVLFVVQDSEVQANRGVTSFWNGCSNMGYVCVHALPSDREIGRGRGEEVEEEGGKEGASQSFLVKTAVPPKNPFSLELS